MNTIKLNIAVIIDPQVSSKAIELSDVIASQFSSDIILDGKEVVPHITLYQAEFPAEQLEAVQDALAKIVTEHKPFSIYSAGLSHAQDGGVYLDFKLTNMMRNLHEKVVKKINPFRDGYTRAKFHDAEAMISFDQRQQELALEYGFPYVLDKYSPHITVAGVKERIDLDKYSNPIDEIRVEEIGIYESGNSGVCKRLLCEFSLN